MTEISPEELTARFSPPRQETVVRLRRLVRAVVPDAIEAVRPGWGLIGYRVPVGRKNVFFAWVWPEAEHVHLGFEHGIVMDDPDRVLIGSGRKWRWVTLAGPRQMDDAVLKRLIREGAHVAALDRGQRFALLLDRDVERVPE